MTAMKKTVECRMSNVEGRQKAVPRSFCPRPSTLDPRLAFTLMELLAVIAIIGLLASFTFPVLQSVKKHQYETNAQAEMAQLETAIDSYKAARGFYPPDNPGNPLTNQLFYELLGTTNYVDSNGSEYQTLDGSAIISAVNATNAFTGMGGFINCSKTGAGEDSPAGKNFLTGLKPRQVGTFTSGTVAVSNLVTSVGGPDVAYSPLGAAYLGLNPWRYNSSSPVNNPGSYDLYVQLSINGKTYLVCNWSKQVQINNPLP